MKIRLTNNNNLNSLEIKQNSISSIESLYITGCPYINSFNIFESINNSENNNLEKIRLDNVTHTGTWTELQSIKNNYGGIEANGENRIYPYLEGTWTLPGIKESDNYNLHQAETDFGGNLEIVADKTIIEFEDSIIDNIINSNPNWCIEYDEGKFGTYEEKLATIYDLGQNFTACSASTFSEFELFTGLLSISNGAFYNCTNLTKINLPNNVTTVGNGVFNNCLKLRTLTYPKNVTYIGTSQITNCRDLDYVRIIGKLNITNNSVSPQFITIEENSFTESSCKIYVGDGSSPWNDNTILNNLLNTPNSNWVYYKNRLDTWFNYLNNKELENTNYKLLDYIESDGVNYIQLENIKFTNNTRFVADISFNEKKISIYGTESSGLKAIPDQGLVFNILDNNSSRDITLTNSNTWVGESEKLIDININEKKLSYNNIQKYYNNNLSINSDDDSDITLFGNSSNSYIGRAWMTDIYQNNILIKHLIPVYNSVTKKAGLYDTIDGDFYSFDTYTGYNFDKVLVTEDNNRITTEQGDSILISDENTNKIKISKFSRGYTNDLEDSDYYTPVYKDSTTKKYNLKTLNSKINNLYTLTGIKDIEFNEGEYYSTNQLVYNNNNIYKFKRDVSSGTNWNDDNVVQTSALDYLYDLYGEVSNTNLNIQLVPRKPIFVDWIETNGTQFLQPSYFIPYFNNSITNSGDSMDRLEIKFSYSNPNNVTITNTNGYILYNYAGKGSYKNTKLQIAPGNTLRCLMRNGCNHGATSTNTFDIIGGNGTANGGGYQFNSVNPNITYTVSMTHDTITLTNHDENTTENANMNTSAGSTYNPSSNVCIFGKSANEKNVLNIKLYYIKAFRGDTCIMNLVPALIYNNTVELYDTVSSSCSTTTLVKKKTVGDDYTVPTEIQYPFANKSITVNSNILSSDNLGDCSTDILNNNNVIEVYIDTYSILEKNYGTYDNITSTYPINNREFATITINITTYDNLNLENIKYVYVLSNNENYCCTGILVKSGEKTSTVIKCSKDQEITLCFPNLTGYIKPNNYIFSTNNNEETFDFVYQQE